jgi:histidinol-phosphate aminotransferase
MADIEKLVRNNILDLIPYSSARDEYSGEGAILMDANENPYNPPFNRYPDPKQGKLRNRLAGMLGLRTDNIFVGNGSDEAIDLLLRVFCIPGSDRITVMDPSYGMYKVCADVNGVATDLVALNEDFSLDPERILAAAGPATKLIFLCSPNNPTSNLMETRAVLQILDEFRGILVVDEAYVDFSGGAGLLGLLVEYPGLVLLRTLSKAWAGAGIRLGMALGDPKLIALMNKVKYPYNVNILTQEKALEMLDQVQLKDEWVRLILTERQRLAGALSRLEQVEKVFPSDANFMLVRVSDPQGLYDHLAGGGVIVRNRSGMTHCEGCLRITVGTPDENDRLLELIKTYR